MEERKVRTTIYLSRHLKELAILQEGNLSALIEQLLDDYIGANTVPQCQKLIKEHKKSINILKKKVEKLAKMGISEDKNANIRIRAYKSLLNSAKERINNGLPINLGWITGPNGINKCKIIGDDPIIVLEKLQKEIDKNV